MSQQTRMRLGYIQQNLKPLELCHPRIQKLSEDLDSCGHAPCNANGGLANNVSYQLVEMTFSSQI